MTRNSATMQVLVNVFLRTKPVVVRIYGVRSGRIQSMNGESMLGVCKYPFIDYIIQGCSHICISLIRDFI